MLTAGSTTPLDITRAVVASFDPHEVWERVAWADGELPPTNDAASVGVRL